VRPCTLLEPYAHLYVGDYFADTLDLAAHEHRALRLLLLETWIRGPIGTRRLASVAGLTRLEWHAVKPSVLSLLRRVQPRIAESIEYIRAFDGQRLPPDDWHIVRSIVVERDEHVCTYCGSKKQIEADHIFPLCRGGSNAFSNLVAACKPCNLSKGAKTFKEWRLVSSTVFDNHPKDDGRERSRASGCP
jgi:5-methylcytosine-specific restriction endonuclease McrA